MQLVPRHYSTAVFALLAANLLAVFLDVPTLAAPAAAALLLLEAAALGAVFFRGRGLLDQHLGGTFLLLCWFMVAGAGLYAAVDLSPVSCMVLWIGTAALAAGLAWRTQAVPVFRLVRSPAPPLLDVVLVGLAGAVLLAAMGVLAAGRTLTAVSSPWQTVSPAFFTLLAAAALLLVALLVRGKTRAALPASILLAFVAAAAALVTYGIGYGFDQFVHQAAEGIILRDGVVEPKTPYYLGQYAAVTLLARVTLLPHAVLDRLAVPLGFAVLAPLVCAWTARGMTGTAGHRLAALAPLLVPFGAYAATTPTGIAYLLALLVAGAGISWRAGALPPAPAVAGTLAALAVHPLVGIPTLGLLLLVVAGRKKPAMPERLAGMAGYALVVLGVPAAFLLNAILGGMRLGWSVAPLEALRALAAAWPRFVPTGELTLDLPYLWRAVVPLALAAAAVLVPLRVTPAWRAGIRAVQAAVSGLLLSFVLLQFVRFPEAGDVGAAAFPFRARILELAAVFLLPVAGAGLVFLWERLARHAAGRLASAGMLAALVAATTYVSFPRLDRIEPSKGYAVSAGAVAAVQWIEDRAAGRRHVVLADQTIAAAAIREHGFVSFPGIPFAYANESGAPELNALFLEMNAAPTRTTARRAMETNVVEEVYFVVNAFWKGSARIAAEAMREADETLEVDDSVTVFVYRR